MLRVDAVSAPLAVIAPPFSTSVTLPDLSTIAVAPAAVPAVAEIVPVLRMEVTLAPVSTTTAWDSWPAVEAPVAVILPELTMVGTVAPAPIRSAVAFAALALDAAGARAAQPSSILARRA